MKEIFMFCAGIIFTIILLVFYIGLWLYRQEQTKDEPKRMENKEDKRDHITKYHTIMLPYELEDDIFTKPKK